MKNQRFMRIMFALVAITATDNLSAMSGADSFWNWLTPSRERAVHFAQNLSSHWSSLSPTQRNIVLATGVLLLGGTAAAYKYNSYQQMQKLAEEQRSAEDRPSRNFREFQLNIQSYINQIANLNLKDRALDDRIRSVNELIRIVGEEIPKNIEQRYPELNEADKQKARNTIEELLQTLRTKKEQYKEEKDKQERDKRKEQEKNLAFANGILRDIEQFLKALKDQDFAIEKEEAHQIESDLDRSQAIINSITLFDEQKEKLESKINTLREKLAEALEPKELEAQLEAKRLRQLSLEEYERNKAAYQASVERGRNLEMKMMPKPSLAIAHAVQRSQPQKTAAQLLEEKREGKEEEEQKEISSSSTNSALTSEPTLSIFNNTNTTIEIHFTYAGSGQATTKQLGSGENVDIPLANQNGSKLTSFWYRESSLTNLSPFPYSVDVQKIPESISNLLTISSGYTAFTHSLTPIISTEQMIQDGLELNNALRSGNDSEVENLRNRIDDLYSLYPLFIGKTKEVTEQYLVKSLILYYYAIAKKLGHVFTEGTFVIYDDTGNIFRFLSSLKGTHARDSSHFNGVAQTEEKHLWLEQLGIKHFGFDLDLIKEMGKRAILFNKLNEDGTALYIKPEEYGVGSVADMAHHALGYLSSVGRKIAPSYVGSDDAPEYSKERVPLDIRNAFKSLLDTAKQHGLPDASYQAYIRYNDVKGMGIQKMLAIAQSGEITNYASEQAEAFIHMLNERHDSSDPLTHAKYTYLDKRFGHEVILTNDEFNTSQDPTKIKHKID